MHVPDTHVPVIKSMKVEYQKRAFGDIRAVAKISEEQVGDDVFGF